MGVPTASGVPVLDGNQIPELYASKILENYYPQTIMREITVGPIDPKIEQVGSKLIIRTTPTTAVREYQVGQDLIFDNYESASIEFNIERAAYWAAQFNTVQMKQADVNMINNYAMDAANRMKIYIETLYFSAIYASAQSQNTGATAGASGSYNVGTTGSVLELNSGNTTQFITACDAILDEANAPNEGRFIVVPTWCGQRIQLSDLNDASLTGDRVSILRNRGYIGTVGKLKVFTSNLLAHSGTAYWVPIFGAKSAVNFALQITEKEMVPIENGFGKKVKALSVFDWKCVKPDGLGYGVIKPKAEA